MRSDFGGNGGNIQRDVGPGNTSIVVNVFTKGVQLN